MDITITTKCDGHCSYCFDEDTEVSTPNGKVKIKDLNKDDLVISYNLDTGILYDNPNIDTEAISLVASHDYLKSYLLDIDTLVKLNNKEIDRQHANINKAESTIKSIEKLNLALMKAKL